MGLDLKRRKGGRRAATNLLAADERREIVVSSRLNVAEAADVDERRRLVKMSRGEYMRACTFGTLPRTVPEINRVAWLELSKLLGNVNQYQAAINRGAAGGYPPALLGAVMQHIEQLRRELIGASRLQVNDDDDQDEAEDESIGR